MGHEEEEGTVFSVKAIKTGGGEDQSGPAEHGRQKRPAAEGREPMGSSGVAAPASPCPSRRGLEPRPRVPIRGGALTQVSVPDQTACPGPPRCYSPGLARRFCPWATAAAARSPAALRRSPPTAGAHRGADPPPIPQGEPPRGVRERRLPGAHVCACA